MKNEQMKNRFINTFFVLTMMLASIAVAPAPAQAQVGENNIFLPIVADGSTQEIEAAGSCYWGSGSGRVYFPIPSVRGGDSTYVYKTVRGENTHSCNDLNLHIEVQHPWANNCRLNVTTWYNGYFTSYSSPAPNRWYTPATNLTLPWRVKVGVTRACGSATIYWAS